MADRFGTSPVVSAFFIAAGLQAITVAVVADALAVEQAKEAAAARFDEVRRLRGLTLVVAAAVAGLQFGLAPALSDWLTNDGRLVMEATTALRWTAPGVAGLCVLTAEVGILNGRGQYATALAMTVVWSAIALVGLVVLPGDAAAVYGAWSAALLIASAGTLAANSAAGFRWRGIGIGLRPRLMAIGAIGAASLLNQLSFPIERHAAGLYVGADAVAAVGYAYKIVAVPVGLVLSITAAYALRTFVLALATGCARFRRAVVTSVVLVGGPLLAGACALYFMGQQLVEVLLERGDFSPTATAATAAALRGYAFGVPALGIYVIAARACQAQQRYAAVVLGSALGAAVNVALVGSFAERWGIVGVTAATSVGNVLAAGMVLAMAVVRPKLAAGHGTSAATAVWNGRGQMHD